MASTSMADAAKPSGGGGRDRKDDRPASAREIAAAAQAKLEKVLISREAMKENIGHTAGMGIRAGVVVGTAGLSSGVTGMVPRQHRNKYRVVRALGAILFAVKGLHKGLKYGEGELWMGVAEGLAAAEVSESAFAAGEAMGAKWWPGAYQQPANQPANPGVQPNPVAAGPLLQVAMTPPSPNLGASNGVREVLPNDPALEAFRAAGRRSRG